MAAPSAALDARGAFAVYCQALCPQIQTDQPTRMRPPVRARAPSLSIERWDIDELGLPDAEQRREWGHGDLTGIEDAQDVIVVSWAAPIDAAAETVTAAGRAALSAGTWIEDLDTGNIYSAATFQTAIERLEVSTPDITPFILLEGDLNEDGSIRIVTRGLGKFGLPELLVDQIPEEEANAAGLTLNAAVQTLFENGYSERFTLNGADIKSTTVRKLSCGIAGEASLSQAPTDPENPYGLLVEMRFDGTVEACQASEPTAPAAPPQQATAPAAAPPQSLEEARAQATTMLNGPVKDAFLRGLGSEEALLVKAPFSAGQGRIEWMWVQLTEWRGEEMVGVLANEPNVVSGLNKGDSVVIENSTVFDYMLFLDDGRREGNATAAFLR
jgi:hypothetical protein